MGRTHTTMHAPFLSEHSGVLLVTLRRKMAELWRFEDCFIPIFINFAKLDINYDVIISNISKNYLKTHSPP